MVKNESGEMKFNATAREVVKRGENVKVYPFATIGFPGFGFDKNKAGGDFNYPLKRKLYPKTVILEDNVEIGAGSNIDRGSWRDTKLGEGTKLDAHVHISHDTIIGKHCVISAGVVIGSSVTIGDKVFIGLNATIRDHIIIGNNATIGCCANVKEDVPAGGLFV